MLLDGPSSHEAISKNVNLRLIRAKPPLSILNTFIIVQLEQQRYLNVSEWQYLKTGLFFHALDLTFWNVPAKTGSVRYELRMHSLESSMGSTAEAGTSGAECSVNF